MRRLVVWGVLLALAGCAEPIRPVVTDQVELADVRADGLDAVLGEWNGRVVMVDFWATWCPSCCSRFPHFVETHKKFADKGLVCVSVSLDNYGSGGPVGRTGVLDFLKKNGASFPNFLLTDDKSERVWHRLGYEGSIPFMVLLDKAGNKVWDSGKKLKDRDLDKLIEYELAR